MTLITITGETGVGDVGEYALLISYLEPPSIGDQLMFFSALCKISVDPLWMETWDPPCERLKKPFVDLLIDPLVEDRKIGKKFIEEVRPTISMTVLNCFTCSYHILNIQSIRPVTSR